MARLLFFSALSSVVLFAQGRGGGEWATGSGDAHRSAWVRADPKISKDSLSKSGFQVAWKVKLPNEPRQSNALFAPVMLDRYIGYRGFRSFAFVAGSSDNVFGIDTDLGRLEWQKHFPVSAAAGTAMCPGGITAGLTEMASYAFPAAGDARGGRGRGGPAKAGVGAPLEGAVTIAQAEAAAALAANSGAGRGRGAQPFPAGPGRGRQPSMVYAISGDGAFHSMYVSNGEEPGPPLHFLPANADFRDPIVVDGFAYAVTAGACGGAPNGVWALDIASDSVVNWKADVLGIALGADGTVYASTAAGDLAALDPKTLNKKASYSAGAAFSTAPVIFENNGKATIAAASKDGNIHLIDAANMTGTAAKAGAPVESFATWQDAGGRRWIVGATAKSLMAWKVGESFEAAWTSREIPAPVAPIVVNGVVFTAAPGSRSSHAALYALDAATGQDLWNSGAALTSYFSRGAGISEGNSQVYLGTNDGTLWAFGFPIEH